MKQGEPQAQGGPAQANDAKLPQLRFSRPPCGCRGGTPGLQPARKPEVGGRPGAQRCNQSQQRDYHLDNQVAVGYLVGPCRLEAKE